jgi:hypothetical protein
VADYILVTGDTVMFMPAFGPATIVPVPGTLVGSGRGNIGKKPVCVDGDEKTVVVPGVVYTSASFPIPGVGILTIDSLGGDQKAQKTKSGGKPVLLKGSTFTAKLQVTVPAQVVSGPSTVPDATPSYSGQGQFVTTNLQVRGS